MLLASTATGVVVVTMAVFFGGTMLLPLGCVFFPVKPFDSVGFNELCSQGLLVLVVTYVRIWLCGRHGQEETCRYLPPVQ